MPAKIRIALRYLLPAAGRHGLPCRRPVQVLSAPAPAAERHRLPWRRPAHALSAPAAERHRLPWWRPAQVLSAPAAPAVSVKAHNHAG